MFEAAARAPQVAGGGRSGGRQSLRVLWDFGAAERAPRVRSACVSHSAVHGYRGSGV